MASKKAVLYLLMLMLGFLVGYFLKPATREAIPNAINSTVNPLAFFTTVETPKGTIYLYMNQDHINLNAVETPYYPKAPIIEKAKYPKLFKQGIANYSALRAEYYKESKDGETYIKLSNIQSDHGGYADTYAILVDPFTGIVQEINEDCEKNNGIWMKAPFGKEPFCNKKYSDGGKVCKDSSDCLSNQCISYPKENNESTGQCANLTTIYGCYGLVEKGRLTNYACRD